MRHTTTLDYVVVAVRASSPRRSSALPGRPSDAPTAELVLSQHTSFGCVLGWAAGSITSPRGEGGHPVEEGVGLVGGGGLGDHAQQGLGA